MRSNWLRGALALMMALPMLALGSGDPPRGREFRDVLGRVNAIWAAAADEAWFVVAGRALELRPLPSLALSPDA